MHDGLESRLIIHNIIKLTITKDHNFDQSLFILTKNKKLSVQNKKFIHNVSLSSIRNYFVVRKIIKNLVKKIDDGSDNFILLLSSITQIHFLKIKEYAVVNSAVELCDKKNINASKKLINACLRNFVRKKKNYNNYSIEFNDMPDWFLLNAKNLNEKEKVILIKNIITQPTLHIVFKEKKNLKKYIHLGKKTSNFSIGIDEKYNFNDIPYFEKGEWWVQDFSAMLPLSLISLKKFNKIADVCSAPGGKLFQILSNNQNVVSYEKSKKRTLKLNENLHRLNYNINLKQLDFLEIDENKKFDLIVLDAPCSSVGTVRRNPDILLKRKIPNIKYFINLQKDLLNKSKLLLKKNGVLIYMVCSFFKNETTDQVENFLKKNNNFSISPFKHNKNPIAKKLINKSGFVYTLPDNILDNIMIDGFFAAKLIKNNENKIF